MSPEQVRGEAVDSRSDIFSFGSLLFELVTGRRLFARDSSADTMAAIMKEEPPELDASGWHLATPIRRILAHCLEKDPARRFQEAQDLAFALESAAGDSGSAPVSEPAAASPSASARRRPARIAAIVSAFAEVALLALWLGRSSASTQEARKAVRFEISAPAGTSFGWTSQDCKFAVSPDGTRIAFSAVRANGNNTLWVRPFSEIQAVELPGTEGVTSCFWSPDGHFLGFFSSAKLKKVDLDGGQPVTLCDVVDPYPSGTWGNRGEILFSGLAAQRIASVPEGGGAPKTVLVTDAARQQMNIGFPVFLPDGRHFLFVERVATEGWPAVRVGDLKDGSSIPLLAISTRAIFVPETKGSNLGRILFARDGVLLAQSFDAGSLKLAGAAVPARQNVFEHAFIGLAPISASHEGTLATRGGQGLTRLIWYDRNGRDLGTLSTPDHYREIHFSLDARKVLTNRKDPRTGLSSIWEGDTARGALNRLEMGPGDFEAAALSPNTHQVAVGVATMLYPPLIYQASLDSAAPLELVKTDGVIQSPVDWAPGGRYLVYLAAISAQGPGFWILDTTGAAPPRRIIAQPTVLQYTSAKVSPDGRWIAYCGTELGRPEIFLTSFPDPGERIRISLAGGTRPRWRGDGRELYFVTANGELTAVPISLGATVQVGTPMALFHLAVTGWQDFDVTADGQRFLVVENLAKQSSDAIVITTHWTSRLGR